MKKTFSLLLLVIATFTALAQQTYFAIGSSHREKFYVFINGEKQNDRPTESIRISDVRTGFPYIIRIEIADRQHTSQTFSNVFFKPGANDFTLDYNSRNGKISWRTADFPIRAKFMTKFVGKPEPPAPNQPGHHDQPNQPGHPGQPNQPGHPGQPNQPGHPGQPNQPGHHDQPNQPGHPGQPNQPGHPGQPNQPGHPGQPNQPGHHDQPNQPGHPGQPNQPGHHDQPNQPGHHDQPNQPGHHDQPNQPGHHDQPNQPGHPGQPNQPGHHDQPNQPGHPGQPNQPGHPGQPTPAPAVVPAPPAPCLQADFMNIKRMVAKEDFEDDKLALAKQAIPGTNMTAMQLAEIARVFSFEDTKLEFLKFAYPFCIDQNKYYLVNDVFSFSTSKDELRKYIGQ